MPVKIRCRGCDKVLNAPDKARGRVITCPNCETKLKVPGGDSATKAQRAPSTAQVSASKPQRKKVQTAAPDPGDSGLFEDLDLEAAEHHEERICPFCAADMTEDDGDICPECGMNVATRQMDAKIARKRSRTKRGINPERFYKGAWKDSFQFVKDNKRLALKTGWYCTVFAALFYACWFMAADYCTKGPPITFWSFCTVLCALGVPGWYWVLSSKVIRGTMDKQEKFDRIFFDFFEAITTGSRAIFWPAIMLLPFMPIVLPVYVFPLLIQFKNHVLQTDTPVNWVLNPQQMIILGVALAAFPLVATPLAMVHMTAKYTYKAWVLWEMLKVFVKNVGPSLYWCLMALFTVIIPFGGLLIGLEAVAGGANPFQNPNFRQIADQIVGIFADEGSMTFEAGIASINFVMAFVVLAPIFLIMGFPLLFIIRANGLLGLHLKGNLQLVEQMDANTPATFWVRLLAFLVDFPLTALTGFLVTANKKAMIVSNLMNGVLGAGLLLWEMPLFILVPAWMFVQMYLYFAISESTTNRSTIGKDGFGLIVSKEDNKQMQLGDATRRYLCGLANVLTLGVGFVMCAFHPQKRALNDILSKTKVVWQGDR